MEKRQYSTTALAACEVCSVIWCTIILCGTVYLTGWQGWNGWTWLAAVIIASAWTCRFCPGHAKYGEDD